MQPLNKIFFGTSTQMSTEVNKTHHLWPWRTVSLEFDWYSELLRLTL